MTMPPPPRWFKAADVLSGQVQLHYYPLPFVAVGAPNTLNGTQAMGLTFDAAHLLESQGWQVVNFADDGRLAYLRRTHPPAPQPGQ